MIVLATILVASVGVNNRFQDWTSLNTALDPSSIAQVTNQLTYDFQMLKEISKYYKF